MAEKIPFSQNFECEYGRIYQLSPLIRRITVNNPGPFTFRGTNCYIIGRGEVAVIDPGPLNKAHLEALLRGLGDERISHIFLTHTHRDHSPGAAPLKAASGAPSYAYGPHLNIKVQGKQLDDGGDTDFVPDFRLADGQIVSGAGWHLEAVHTPGHISNHLCFCLQEENALLTGDHVMGWSTSVIAPPWGNMGDYFASLEKLLGRDDRIYWPAHGGEVLRPKTLTRALIAHRRMREAAILERLQAGDRRIEEMVAQLYKGLDPRLTFAAGLSVQGHLEHLIERGIAGYAAEAQDEYILL